MLELNCTQNAKAERTKIHAHFILRIRPMPVSTPTSPHVSHHAIFVIRSYIYFLLDPIIYLLLIWIRHAFPRFAVILLPQELLNLHIMIRSLWRLSWIHW